MLASLRAIAYWPDRFNDGSRATQSGGDPMTALKTRAGWAADGSWLPRWKPRRYASEPRRLLKNRRAGRGAAALIDCASSPKQARMADSKPPPRLWTGRGPPHQNTHQKTFHKKGDIVGRSNTPRDQARKGAAAFASTLPSLRMFERGENGGIENITGVDRCRRKVGFGQWLITLPTIAEFGARSTPPEVTLLIRSRTMPVKIRKGALGSYMVTSATGGPSRERQG